MSQQQTDDPVSKLDAAATGLEDAEAAVEEVGEARVRAVTDAYDRATDLFDRYRDRASGSGGETFRAFVEFQERFANLIEGLDDDLLERDAFEAANDRLDKRRLSERDFDRADEALAPAGDVAGLLDRRTDARRRYREARDAVERRLSAVEGRIDELERLERLGEADIDAPVSRLRDPIDAYNEAVEDAFGSFRRTASARELLSFVEATTAYPLVDFRAPPEDLREFVFSDPAGEVPVPTLLDYADYSASKLDHYVEHPSELKTRVAVHRTYLERLGPGPLLLSWPPASAGRLRHRVGELVSVVGRFAPEETVARLRIVRNLTRNTEYERLRRAAVALAELGDEERERLASGEIAAELADTRETKDRLRRALEEYPSR